jgi:hypothetical protein
MARIRPSKPVAIFGAVFGAAILIFGIVQMGSKGGAFLWLWVAAGVAIIGFNLWAAFAKRGALQIIDTDERPPDTKE